MTVAELVTRALQLAGIVGMNRTPSAFEMNDGLATLNEMLESWALDGMDMGMGTLLVTDEDLWDASFVRGIRYSLAVELAAAHGLLNELPAHVPVTAESEQGKIRAALADIDYARCDKALLWRGTNFNFDTGQ